MASLKDKTITGMLWSLLQNVGSKGIMFVVMIILARLLTPKIFGLIGMLMIFIQLSQTLVIAGFNQALIQKKDTDEEDYSSVFWINLVVSLLIYGILFFAAPYIAQFYDQAILTELTRVLSFVFVINAFSYVQEAKLSKEMRFKILTLVHVPSTILGGVVSVVMAFMGYGIWSIIALQLITRFAFAVQIWIYSKWKPLLKYNGKKAKKLFAFGSNLMLTAITTVIYKNIYLVIIGKFFPVSYVGYYQNATNLIKNPTAIFSGAISKVTFPAFSSIQENNSQLRRGLKKVNQQVLFWICPVILLAAVLAVPLFEFVFTEKWLPAVPYFRILCLIGILYPLNSYTSTMLNVKGKSGLFLRLAILKRIITTIGIVLVIYSSDAIWYLLIFESINAIIMFFINGYFAGRLIKYPLFDQIKDVMPIILLSCIVSGIVFLEDRLLLNASNFIRLLIGFILGGGLYFFAAKFLKMEAFRDFIVIGKDKLQIVSKRF